MGTMDQARSHNEIFLGATKILGRNGFPNDFGK